MRGVLIATSSRVARHDGCNRVRALKVLALAAAPFSAYVAAKGGQTGLALSTARELAGSGITVNMVAPGWIPVERHAGYSAEAMEQYRAGVPAGRMGVPSDVAPAVVFLASDEARFITGQTVSVNGGNSVLKDALSEMSRVAGSSLPK